MMFVCLAGSAARAETDLKKKVVDHYAVVVHAAYSDALSSAEDLDRAIKAFTGNPEEKTLKAAKKAWLKARRIYGPSEVFRFYGGPIDDDDGPEGLINAWPLDEAYIDYVEG
ncbi:MAG: imelysin family protein, partial [Verrucomicrobiota bacterium]